MLPLNVDTVLPPDVLWWQMTSKVKITHSMDAQSQLIQLARI